MTQTALEVEKPAQMTAADVREALLGRWPPSEYLTVYEAPQDSMRQGRKIDALVVSLWKSRGHALDAVEIKVSITDWKRELENAAKADWWWEHSHRFWVAVPLVMAPKVRDQLPQTWGLLACSGAATKVVVQAPHHEPTPLPWTATIGIMRAASGAGANALLRAEERGRNQGYETGKKNGQSANGNERLEELRALVKEAEDATGIPIARWSNIDREGFGGWGVTREDVHAAVADLVKDRHATKTAREELERVGKQLQRAYENVSKLLNPDALS